MQGRKQDRMIKLKNTNCLTVLIWNLFAYLGSDRFYLSIFLMLIVLTGCSFSNNIDHEISIGKNNLQNIMKDTRQPAVAGQFYPADERELKEQIEGFLEKADSPRTEGRVRAIMAPHAGYDFSGQVAAEAYKQIQAGDIKTVVIIGNSHSSFFEGAAIDGSQGWDTPLGEVAIDARLANKMVADAESIVFDSTPHEKEHSLEVQLPFLQTVLGNGFQIVPILFGNIKDESECRALAEILAAHLREDDIVVVSSDMSHYPSYEDANRMDKQTLKIIESCDIEELEEHINTSLSEGVPGEDTLLCGEDAVKTVMHLANIKQWDIARVLKYANSGDVVIGDKDRVVGYGAMVFADSTAKEEAEQEQEAPIEASPGMFDKIASPLTPKQRESLLGIAQKTVESYISQGVKPEFNITDDRLQKREGAFVTLKKDGELRGCIGHIVQTEKPLWQAVQDLAIASALKDDRFEPVTLDELPDLTYEVSVLSEPLQVDDWRQVQPGEHGVIIRQGGQTGVFLPQVAKETGWNREEFLSQLCFQKLGSTPDCYKDPESEIFIFTAQVFSQQ
jgi:hypothetical protein